MDKRWVQPTQSKNGWTTLHVYLPPPPPPPSQEKVPPEVKNIPQLQLGLILNELYTKTWGYSTPNPDYGEAGLRTNKIMLTSESEQKADQIMYNRRRL